MKKELLCIDFQGYSMSPSIKPGDKLYYREPSIHTALELGDIIIFIDSKSKELVTHRIIKLNPIQTKGDNSIHSETIKLEQVIGIVQEHKRKDQRKSIHSSRYTPLILFISKLSLKSSALRRLMYLFHIVPFKYL